MDLVNRQNAFAQKNTQFIKQQIFAQDDLKDTVNKKTKTQRNARETSEERKIRREKDRLRIAAARARETVEERNTRLAIERERKRALRARENSESKEIRNAKNRMRQAINRTNETFEETQTRKINDRIRHMKLRSRETLQEREIRLAKDRARHRKYRYKTFQKIFIENANNLCEIPSCVNNQVQWLRFRESLVNLKHSESANKILKEELSSSQIQIKEESIDIVEELNAQETKTPLNIKTEPSDIKPYSDSLHEENNVGPIKKENFIYDNVASFFIDNKNP